MSGPTEDELRSALRGVADPATGRDIVAAGRVEAVQTRDGLVQVTLLTERTQISLMEPVRRQVEQVLGRVAGVRNVSAVLTSATPAAASAAGAPAAPRARDHGHDHGPGRDEGRRLLADVGAVVAVASGKGGVGKSTVATNLAVALAGLGLRVGLLDADIYGPSLPRMLGVARRPEVEGQTMIPIKAWGLSAMSVGFLVEEETAMIWRGPMVMGALEQMMGQVRWGPLDIMIVDMPPGTGDAQLTMAQRVALAGAVIVSTPQDIALIDARRGVRMFEKVRVPVLGLIENMSYFHCPSCGARAEIFGHGGARLEAKRLGVDFLGEVPLLLDVRAASDAGTPVVISDPSSQASLAIVEVARRLWEKVGAGTSRPAAPRIVMS